MTSFLEEQTGFGVPTDWMEKVTREPGEVRRGCCHMQIKREKYLGLSFAHPTPCPVSYLPLMNPARNQPAQEPHSLQRQLLGDTRVSIKANKYQDSA